MGMIDKVRVTLLGGLAAAAVATATHTPATVAAVPQPSWAPQGTMASAFSDGFNGTTIRPVWSPSWWVHPGAISWSDNTFMTACYAATHDTVSGGYLHMLLDATPNTCGTQRQWTGAVMTTHAAFSQGGGAFEARVDLPCNTQGQVYGWPAWWQLDNTWTGEVDDVEAGWPAAPNGGTAAHLEYGSGNPGWQSAAPLCGWHKYGSQWGNGTVTFYWDSKPVFAHAFPVDPATNPEYVILDYQMSGQAVPPPAGGAVMAVDWVRVWK